jgi:Xaa-Pro aminopeptidase
MMKHLSFDADEFTHRLTRAQRSMDTHQLDALVLTAPPNFRYFCGFESQFWESPARPWFLIVPAKGRPVAVVPEIGAPLLATNVVGRVLTWPAPRPQDEGVSLLASTLLDLPKRYSRIGFELGRESVLRMPILDFFKLKENLRGIDLVDGSPCIWEVRSLKSEAEIQTIRRICQIVGGAFDALPEYARVGASEREICREFTMDILRRGADAVPFMACASGPGGYPEIISQPGSRRIEERDVLFIDVGATIDGYFCDFDRNFGIGNISDAARRAHEAAWQATEAGIKAAVVGAKVSDLWACMMAVLKPAGMIGNNVGRLGHGLGLQLTEPPSNMAEDEAVLKAGMVITIEPGMEYEEGKMIVHEEDIAISESGPILLTIRAPREMRIVKV